MCGIAGYLGTRSGVINKMLASINHRGPDSSNIFTKDNFSIGMNRLKIIDLKSDNLCLHKFKQYTLAYNGEIYNFKELKKELILKKYKFETKSDTEVVLKSFDCWGTDCFKKFNGMFALAIYDDNKKKIILARDISGEKPLYYFYNGSEFAFSSEAKAFKGNFELHKLKKNLEFFNKFQFFLNETPWKEVNALEPANFISFCLKNKKIEMKEEYWKFKQRKIYIKDAYEELDYLIKDSVKLRTNCDVNYGLYYSGGLDSAIISKYHKFKYKYFFDKNLNWKREFNKDIKKIVWHLDFPVGSFSSFPLWTLAKMASKEVKVILSGEGADELFGGYIRYMPVAQEFYLKKKYPSYKDYLFKKFYKFDDYLDSFTALTSRNKNDFEFIKSKFTKYKDQFEDPINMMGYLDFKYTLPSLLQMGDRMSSAYSLENRCPYLDKRIIEFAFSLPPELKIKNNIQKILLRKIAKEKKLDKILKKEKEGLVVFFNQWHKSKSWNRNLYFDYLKKLSSLN